MFTIHEKGSWIKDNHFSVRHLFQDKYDFLMNCTFYECWLMDHPKKRVQLSEENHCQDMYLLFFFVRNQNCINSFDNTYLNANWMTFLYLSVRADFFLSYLSSTCLIDRNPLKMWNMEADVSSFDRQQNFIQKCYSIMQTKLYNFCNIKIYKN